MCFSKVEMKEVGRERKEISQGGFLPPHTFKGKFSDWKKALAPKHPQTDRCVDKKPLQRGVFFFN